MPFRMHSKPFALSAVFVGFISMVAAIEGRAQERPKIELQTVYLQEMIGRAHQITVRGELGGAGEVVLDGNTCTITQFGDRGVCTQIAFPAIPVKIEQLRLADSSGAGRRIFQLQGDLQPADAKFFLVVPRRRSEPHRLVVDLSEDQRRVVTLETVVAPPAKPELGKNAEYEAIQRDGTVTIAAKGTHPTAGWKAALEQLPIEIFPPQFRLVVTPPAGGAAQVITPFEVSASFAAKDPVNQVVVYDGDGKHNVTVKQE